MAQIVKDLAEDEVKRGTKLSPAIRPGFEAIYHEIQLVLEVTLIPRGLSVILGIPMNLKSSTFDIYHATPLYQPNNDQKTASLFNFANPFLTVSTDNSRFAELGANTLQQCLGNNRIKLCRKGFSTTTDETLLCLGSSFYNYDIPASRNCEVRAVHLPDAPQAFYLADGMYPVIRGLPPSNSKTIAKLTAFLSLLPPVRRVSYALAVRVHWLSTRVNWFFILTWIFVRPDRSLFLRRLS